MTKLRNREVFTTVRDLSFIMLFWVAMATVSSAQSTLTTLVTFDGSNGANPFMVLAQGSDGNFYGTTYGGGANDTCFSGCGAAFEMTSTGTLTTLYNFCSQTGCADGAGPVGSLVQNVNGDFYGTTSAGGTHGGGSVFKITPAGTLTTLYSFCAFANCADGQEPTAGLVQGRNGNFYGTTQFGGVYDGGTVFEITQTGKLSTLHNFNGTDGYSPSGALIQASNGNFYGETVEGEGIAFGTIFEITPAGKLTTLYSFLGGSHGDYPTGGLVQAADGNFYGVTAFGGIGNYSECNLGCGTVFKITSAGKLTTLHNFCSSDCTDGAEPFGPLVQATDGNLYGTTKFGGVDGGGIVFQTTPRGQLTTLYAFCTLANCADGEFPEAGLLQATNGSFYGTTFGNVPQNDGTTFSLSTGLGSFVKTQPTSAKEGATVGIFGQGFTSSSAVQFGGVQATNIKPSGSTFLFATVPAGALTGSVTVTTDGTTLTSNQPFRVKPQVLSFNPPSGPVGTQVTITGVGFTQTNGVGFGDNVPAQFTVNSDTEVTATIPAGAKTGPIGVVTKGGTAISSATFTVN